MHPLQLILKQAGYAPTFSETGPGTPAWTRVPNMLPEQLPSGARWYDSPRLVLDIGRGRLGLVLADVILAAGALTGPDSRAVAMAFKTMAIDDASAPPNLTRVFFPDVEFEGATVPPGAPPTWGNTSTV